MIAEKSNRFKLSLFFILYFSQGVLFAYMSLFHKPYLDSQGVEADEIALLNVVVMLPFVLKIAFGYISDRYSLFGRGHRLPYIAVGVVSSVVAFAALGIVAPSDNVHFFGALLTCFVFSIALMDSSADGMAVDVTAPVDRQAVQASMVIGRFGAIIVVAILFGALAEHAGHPAAFLTVAILLALPLVWLFQLREGAERNEVPDFEWAALKSVLTRSYVALAGLSLLFGALVIAALGLFTYYMSRELHASSGQIGAFGAVNSVAVLVGAGVSVPLLRKYPQFKVRAGLFALWSASLLAWSFRPSIVMCSVLGGVSGLVFGVLSTVYLGIAMARTQSRAAGTMFAMTMAILNLGLAMGDGLFTSLTDDVGCSWVFRIQAGLGLLLILLLGGITRSEPDALVGSHDSSVGGE